MSHYSMGLSVSVIGIWNNEPLFWLKQAFSYSGILNLTFPRSRRMYFYEKGGEMRAVHVFKNLHIQEFLNLVWAGNVFFVLCLKNTKGMPINYDHDCEAPQFMTFV